MERPRFIDPTSPDFVMPEGMETVRSHKRLAIIRVANPGDAMYGRTPYTVGQVKDLQELQRQEFAERAATGKSEVSIYEP